MRKKLIAANLKMHKNIDEAKKYISKLSNLVVKKGDRDVVVAASSILLSEMKRACNISLISLSAQNVHWENSGAFTGELSPQVLKDLGINYTILGHSERRQYFGESDESLNKRLKNAIKNNLSVIFCIGESLKERQSNKTEERLNFQIEKAFKGISKEDMKNISIAYEPIWAIGTGLSATSSQAEETHQAIRKTIEKLYDLELANNMQILYGGSVKPKNAKEILSQKNIDGVLVGGASLDPNDFIQIINFDS